MDTTQIEVIQYWRQIIGTLHQRGMLRERPRQGGVVLPEATALLLPDRCVFVLDMQRLAGIAREDWLDRALWEQCRAALQGRRVIVSDGGGLAIQVGREPGQKAKRLPAVIPLDLEALPPEPYTVTLGHTKRGPLTLDLAGEHRAILTGGTSGAGKTNLMQSIILQLAAKHTPDQVRFAIVDTKEVDFGADYERLPHLFTPPTFRAGIAHDLESAHRLVEAVEAERLRRQVVMAQAGVAGWRELPACPEQGRREGARLPLLLLVVDEAADLARTPTMATLVEIARKGRAMGVSLVLGTQSPSAQVIDPQVRANLPTAIAFQTRTDIESRVILGCKGAEALNRPGLALAFLDGHWQTVQTLRVTPDLARKVIGAAAPAAATPLIGDVEARLVRYALDELSGAFAINTLAAHFAGRISRRQLLRLGQQWERRGWLTAPARVTDPRRVTPELEALVRGVLSGSTERLDRAARPSSPRSRRGPAEVPSKCGTASGDVSEAVVPPSSLSERNLC